MKDLDQAKVAEFTFQIKKLASVLALDEFGIVIDGNQLNITVAGDMIRGLLSLATQEEPILELPDGLWEHFKERWFPRWLKRRYPVRMKWVVAYHKYPELAVPESMIGREFVHLKIVDPDRLMPIK